jgi:4,5-dihydroxyphthalate decarboxylase
MNFAVLARPRTQAILDGRVKATGMPIDWRPIPDPLNWVATGENATQGNLSGGFDGGEMSISSFVQAKARGAPLLALPIFLKRGLAQRSLFCAAGSAYRSPAELIGKRIGLVGYHSSMAVWMKGVLADAYGLSRSDPLWCTLTPAPISAEVHTKLVEIPKEFSAAEVQAWEELDGYAHKLNLRESFLLSLLERNELDAVISFQATIAAANVRTLLPAKNDFWSHYRSKGVYPINHLFVLHEHVFNRFPDIGESLLSAFKAARKLWTDYLPAEERGAIEAEIESLGWDPFAYDLGPVEKTTLETFIGYLRDEKLISHKPAVQSLFWQLPRR